MPIRDKESLRFVHCLTHRDPNVRGQAFDNLTQILDAWIGGYGSPLNNAEGGNVNISTFDQRQQVKEYLVDFLRLSHQCPFEDVRQKCAALLIDLKERGRFKIPQIIGGGPSRFISEDEVVPVNNPGDDQTQMLFIDAFLQNNRIDYITQIMGFHPKYLECFLSTQQYLLRGDGPLPFHYRHYIAIMAAGRHQCGYLMHLHEQEFILQGGNPEWLKGPNYTPTKLKNLNEVNKLMAHRPWMLNKLHIENLTRGKDNWSLSEVMQAIILLSHFHALCSFVNGCGIKAEIDHNGGHSFRSSMGSEQNDTDSDSSSLNGEVNTEPEVGIEILLERMKKITEEGEEETTEEERLKRFNKIELQSAEITTSSRRPSPVAEIMKYVEDIEFSYKDFAKKRSEEELPTFRIQDYNWEEHAFSLANRLYPDIGTHLDDKFNTAYNLTYYTMGENNDVDTTAFRRSIWNYIHCLYGIMHDDYNYGQVNQLLERNLKAYIKTVTCYPERLTKKEYDNVMREFKHSEKVHVNLMLLEARQQGELLYALRAVNQYMT